MVLEHGNDGNEEILLKEQRWNRKDSPRRIFAFRNGRQALLNETHDLVEFVEEDSAAGLEKFWLEMANVCNPGGVHKFGGSPI